jgi:hypothetical protein
MKKISLAGYLTQIAAAQKLGVTRQRIFTLCQRGQLAGLVVGSTVHPSRASVARYATNTARKHRPLNSRKSKKNKDLEQSGEL